MRSHRRREPLDHVLVAASYDDLETVRALLVCLPATAYGQVYVETAGQPLPVLPAPARVTVSALRRPSGAVPGELLARAVDAWSAEWAPAEPAPDRVFSLWVNAAARDRAATAGEHLGTL